MRNPASSEPSGITGLRTSPYDRIPCWHRLRRYHRRTAACMVQMKLAFGLFRTASSTSVQVGIVLRIRHHSRASALAPNAKLIRIRQPVIVLRDHPDTTPGLSVTLLLFIPMKVLACLLIAFLSSLSDG
ncbi:hypothetical protein K491DRAFT_376556 [Lophiostoma macrostomum CBS 122681]|uniref:Uncharacterized protein n=1 Tax=Lophiostoma macrostomum CBS 122681 TaxID=1314788 RepID=A0A6A6T8Z1_9PLEO|nr:hypothetical protein K491DRAFT_376556 [Lophiostoma macrostomum CBS 122681]